MARNDLHRCGRTLIRKTSLLHKIDPTARRSSFADVSIPRDFSHDRLASMEMPGVARRRDLSVTRNARIDLLFTMSDNRRASRQSRERAD